MNKRSMLTGAISRFAVTLRSSEVASSSFLNVKRNRSCVNHFSKMTSSQAFGKKVIGEDLKPKAAALKDVVVVEGAGGSSGDVEEQNFGIDLANIDSMTVQELRSTLRGFGISAKGLKRDLLSALKLFLEKKTLPAHGDGLEQQQSSSGDKNGDVTVSSYKRKSEKSCEANDDLTVYTSTEISQVKIYKRRVKQSMTKNNVVEMKETSTTNEQVIQLQGTFVTLLQVISFRLPCSSIKEWHAPHKDNQYRSLFDQTEPWTILAHKKPKPDWVAYNPKTMRPRLPLNGTKSTKLLSWNVNGLRALLKIKGLSSLAQEDFDVLCLQETKLQEKDVELIKQSLMEGYENSYWTCSVAKLGYSGTAIISKIKPISVTYGLGIVDHDNEGRIVTAEFETFYLICAYVPNSGDGLRRLSYRITEWDPSLSSYLKELEKSKPVILTGDLNCAHQEIDIYNPAGNKRSAGFTDEERQSFEVHYLQKGFVDTFRNQHPGVVGYTYWGYRHGGRKTNKGWRLDYFLASESIADKVHDSYILPNVVGSDHSPIGLILKI
ncbi:unnamed protein product [Rhodiola kirilowii]